MTGSTSYRRECRVPAKKTEVRRIRIHQRAPVPVKIHRTEGPRDNEVIKTEM